MKRYETERKKNYKIVKRNVTKRYICETKRIKIITFQNPVSNLKANRK
jgi:hypothetical protein